MKIDILGHPYELTIDPTVQLEEKSTGACCPPALWMRITPNCPKSRQEETALHEIIEAINYELELQLPHEKITQISTALHQVFKTNALLNFSKLFAD